MNQADPDGKASSRSDSGSRDRRRSRPGSGRLSTSNRPSPALFQARGFRMKRMVVARRAGRLGRIGAFAFDSKWERVGHSGHPRVGSGRRQPRHSCPPFRQRQSILDPVRTPKTIITDVAFSPRRGNTIITAGGLNNRREAGELKIWDAASGELLHTLSGHTKLVLSVACSPDGKLIASGGFDRTVRIWNAETGVQTALFKGDGCRSSVSGRSAGTARRWSRDWGGAEIVKSPGRGDIPRAEDAQGQKSLSLFGRPLPGRHAPGRRGRRT